MSSQSPVPQRMPGLDALRGVAILGVVAGHGLGAANTAHFPGIGGTLIAASAYGANGVTLFFVLSGFLITGILLRSVADRQYYRNFYWRRILRILPAYLVTLLVLKASASISWGYLAISVAYLSNMPSLFGYGAEYGPLWSLSIEEQFYLLWPWVVRKLPLLAFRRLAIAILLCSPVIRIMVLSVAPLRDIGHKAPYISDTFAMGALLAIWSHTCDDHRVLIGKSLRLMCMGAVLWVILWIWGGTPSARFAPAFSLTWQSLCFGGIILGSVQSPWLFRNAVGRFLTFIGTISYGLYLVHQFIYDSFDRLTGHARTYESFEGGRLALRLFLCAGLSIAIAALSRYTFEDYFLSSRGRFSPEAAGQTA